eukprot:6670192-Lingulodinium_polyedra.AAC.1
MTWAQQFSGVSELRDQREVLTLCKCLDHLNRHEVPEAVDTLAQRVVSVQAAKQKGGSWEKSELMELIPTGALCLAPGGVSSLGR